jgi:hypothetical protein
MTQKALITCLGCLLFAVACTENGTTELSMIAPYSADNIPAVYPIAVNTNNPYDSVGIYHNSAMAMILRNCQQVNVSHDSLFIVGLQLHQAWPDSMGIFAPEWYTACINALNEFNADRTRDWGAYLENYTSPALSAKEISYINRVGALGTLCATAQAFEDSIIVIETAICDDNWGSNENAAYLCISITKHSFYFWSALAGEQYFSKTAKTTEGLPEWASFVLADATGAVVSAPLGPLGSVSGSVLFSFGGGWVGGYLEEALDQIGGAIEKVVNWLCFWCDD